MRLLLELLLFGFLGLAEFVFVGLIVVFQEAVKLFCESFASQIYEDWLLFFIVL